MSDPSATLRTGLESLLARPEGVRRFAYDDATGKPVRPGTTVRGKVTIGVGRDLIDTGLSTDQLEHSFMG